MSEKYNGWNSYETWLVSLHLEWSRWYETCSDVSNVNELAEMIKDEFIEYAPELDGVYSDLLNAAVSRVDWHELAQSVWDDYKSEHE